MIIFKIVLRYGIKLRMNNILNVNTFGYKRLIFYPEFIDFNKLSRNMKNSDFEKIVSKGVNIDFSQGSLKQTYSTLDISIAGDGFFILSDGKIYYTRNGSFTIDAKGFLLDQKNKRNVLGKNYHFNKNTNQYDLSNNTELEKIIIRLYDKFPPTETTEVEIGNNIDSKIPEGQSTDCTIEIYNDLGNIHSLKMKFKRISENSWEVVPDIDGISCNIGFSENLI